MEYLLTIPLVVLLASIPWIIWPLRRTVETEQVGYVLERLILGFWFQVGNLSDRKNSLEIKLDKLTKEVGKTQKMLEDEKKALKAKVQVLNQDYQSHLHDQGGKRSWKYLFRKCHVPSFAFVKELAKKKDSGEKKRVTYFTLENAPLPPDWVHEKDRGRLIKRFVFHDNSKNQQQQSNNQRKKGGNNNQQNQQGNNNQNN